MRYVVLLLCALMASVVSAAAQSYQLESGDIVEIWTPQEPSLNRSVVVRPDGAISLPLVGHLQVRGFTLEELEKAIVDKLETFYQSRIELVAILAPPPEPEPPMIYVAGDVNTPGAYRYRPGMTVLHAVSVAGGLLRAEATEQSAEIIDTRRQLELLARQSATATARELRLQAELAGRSEIVVPEDLKPLSPQLEQAIAEETELIGLRKTRLDEELEAINGRITVSQKEVEALSAGRIAIENQAAQLQSGYDKLKALVERGLVPEMRTLEIGIRLDELTRSRHEIDASLARANGAILQGRDDLIATKTRYRLEMSTELGEVQRQKEELRISTQAATRRMMEFGNIAALPDTNAPLLVSYTVLRQVDGKMQEIPAEEISEVMLGDLVRVRQSAPPGQ